MDKAHFIKMIADRTRISEDAIWHDVRTLEKSLKSGVSAKPGLSAKSSSSTSAHDHFDLVERRMFGLLNLMESHNHARVIEYRDRVKNIAGESYDHKIRSVEPVLNDMTFEAEAFFGHDQSIWDRHIDELISNFEEDIIAKAIIESMNELRRAESVRDSARVAEMASRCQELSKKKAEVLARRRK